MTTEAGQDVAAYERQARAEVAAWREKVLRRSGPLARAAGGVQRRINRMIPEKIHAAVTAAIEQMTRAIMTGADFTTADPLTTGTLADRETKVQARIDAYRKTGAVEGAVAGAGGFLLAAAEFPVLMGTKIKLLFDIAALYGHDGRDPDERLFILSIFQMAFSSAEHRHEIFAGMADWDARRAERAAALDGMDWRRFQQQYRDYIDLAKLAQLLPVVGAPVGAAANFVLLDRLGATAVSAYRMRWFARGHSTPSA